MWRLGPWSLGKLDQVRNDVDGYFRAYYAELRRLLTEHEGHADIPVWFRGGRQITTHACTDGVVIGHVPYEPELRTFPEREDSYEFTLAVERGFSVVELVHDLYSMEFPDGSTFEVMPHFQPGSEFPTFVRLWPAYMFSHPLPNGRDMGSASHWTRLDAVAMNDLDRWQDKKAARREAWQALRPYVEGWEKLPVPLPDA